MDGQIRFEYGHVWTWKFFESGKKNLRIKKYPHTSERGLRYDRIAMSIKFDNVTRATMARKFAKKCPARSGFFFCLSVKPVACFFYFHDTFAVIVVDRAPQ